MPVCVSGGLVQNLRGGGGCDINSCGLTPDPEVYDYDAVVMVYAITDSYDSDLPVENNLDNCFLRDLMEMEAINDDRIKIIVYVDFFLKQSINGQNTNVGLFEVVYNPNLTENPSITVDTSTYDYKSERISDYEFLNLSNSGYIERDSTESSNLENFLNFCISNYHGYKYVFIPYNHGSGFITSSGEFNSFGLDCEGEEENCDPDSDNYNPKMMDLYELSSALNNSVFNENYNSNLEGDKLGLIAFHACIMGELEVLYEIADYTDYIVSSQEVMQTAGFAYTDTFNNWTDRALIKNLAKSFVEATLSINDEHHNAHIIASRFCNLITVNASKLENLAQEFESFWELAFDRLDITERCADYRSAYTPIMQSIRDNTLQFTQTTMVILQNEINYYTDIKDFMDNYIAEWEALTGIETEEEINASIEAANNVLTALDNAIIYRIKTQPNQCGMSFFYPIDDDMDENREIMGAFLVSSNLKIHDFSNFPNYYKRFILCP